VKNSELSVKISFFTESKKKNTRNLEGMASLASHELERAVEQRARVPKRHALLLVITTIITISYAVIVHHHDVQELRRLRHRSPNPRNPRK